MEKYQTSLVSIMALVFILVSSGILLCGCGADKKSEGESGTTAVKANLEVPEIRDLEISREEDYGQIAFDKTSPEFLEEHGIVLGDSVNVEFSNGYKLEDLPYYTGYYCLPGEKVMRGPKRNGYVSISINYGDSLWDTAGLSEGDTATITLCEKAKYLDNQECCNLSYGTDRAEYDSDEEFANFRTVSAGKMKENTVFRSASPVNNRYNRAACVDDLTESAKVKYIVDLADNKNKVEEYMSKDDYDSPYFTSLYENDKVSLLDMDMNFLSDTYRNNVISGLRAMIDHEGPYLIHCTEGKDRSGFFLAILEAMADASYDEIIDDYMLSYENYYGITKESDEKRYNTIKEYNIDPILEYITKLKTEDMNQADLRKPVEEYLKEGGMKESEISALEEKLCK